METENKQPVNNNNKTNMLYSAIKKKKIISIQNLTMESNYHLLEIFYLTYFVLT